MKRKKNREAGPVHGPALPDKQYTDFARAITRRSRGRGRLRVIGGRGGLSGARSDNLHDHRKGVSNCRACQSALKKAPTQIHLGRAWGKLFVVFLGFAVFVTVLYFMTVG